jgi:hypothetical protein
MNPFFTAIGVGVGTMVAMGGSTIVVSGLGMAVAKRVVKARQVCMLTMFVSRVRCECDDDAYCSESLELPVHSAREKVLCRVIYARARV